ncbi:hypothetical protein XH98_06810 [Bradyrhizobium sp. CCBAU 51745]|uniref:hypothetical protein n=1 Tax=Bradyrhizobium sp. CCBAU 51745 TaxID=1325099 RepID=UPI00230603D2|nr:hypothetical protein [Bradyrhizobium sp. CCBAU 51745]MDA9438833.1 hypothetical protein [Bradyrhizobium sp. CCBAU 51745]
MRVGVRRRRKVDKHLPTNWHARISCVCCIDAAIFDEGNSVHDPAEALRTMAPEVCDGEAGRARLGA